MLEIVIMASAARLHRLEQALRQEPSFRIAGVAGTFPTLRSLLDQTAADAVIVDLTSAPSETVHEWLLELLDLVPLIVLGSETDESILNSILQAESAALLRPE